MFGLTEKQMAKCKDLFKDEDGYWAFLKEGYVLKGYFSQHVIHEDTLAEFKKCFKYIEKTGE